MRGDRRSARNLISGKHARDVGGGIEFSSYAPGGFVEPSRRNVRQQHREHQRRDLAAAASTSGDTKAQDLQQHDPQQHVSAPIGDGGGVYLGAPTNAGDLAEFVNNLLTQNQAPGYRRRGGLYVEAATNPIVRNNDLWGNTPGQRRRLQERRELHRAHRERLRRSALRQPQRRAPGLPPLERRAR